METSAMEMERSRLSRWWPVILISLVIIFYFLPSLLLRRFPYVGDIRNYYYPGWAYFSQALRAGNLPLWCRGIYCGFPLFADSELALFYPLNLLLFQMPTQAGFYYSLALHFLLGAWFSYAYCRRIRLGKAASVFASLSFTLGGFFLSHMVHPNVVATSAWMPLFLYCLERALGERRPSFFVLAGGVMGVQFLSGFLMIPLMEAGVGLLYALFYPSKPQAEGRRPLLFSLGGLALAVSLGLGLGMIQNLPSYHLVSNSYRAGGLGGPVSGMGNLPPAQLLGLVFPRSFGRGVGQVYWGAWTFEETYAYVGILPLFFLPAALLPPRRWHSRFFLGLGLVSLVLCLGNGGLLWPLVHRLPGFNVLKGSSRFLLLLNFALCMLGGMGLDRWLQAGESPRVRRRLLRFWGKGVLLMGGLVFAFILLYHLNPLDFRTFSSAFFGRLMPGLKMDAAASLSMLGDYFRFTRPEIYLPLAITLLMLLCLYLSRGRGGPRRWVKALVVTVAVADVFLFSALIYRPLPAREVNKKAPVVDVLEEQAGEYRVALCVEPGVERNELPLCPNQLLPYGLEEAFGFSTIPPARLDRFLARMDMMPDTRGFELLGVGHLLSNLVKAGGSSYDVSSPGQVRTALSSRRYSLPSGAVGGVMMLLDGGVLEEDASGELLIMACCGGEGSPRAPWALRLRKERGSPALRVEDAPQGGEVATRRLSFTSPGYAGAREAIEVRVSFAKAWESGEMYLASCRDPGLGETSILAVDVVDGRGRSLPLQEWPLVYADGDNAVYRLPDPLPTACVAEGIGWAESWREAVDRAGRGDYEEGEVILSREEIEPGLRRRLEELGPAGEGARARVVEKGNDRLSLRTETRGDAVLILNMDYLPGWKAYVDGGETPLFSAYGFLSALLLPAGEHRVELRYRPPGLAAGAWVSLVSLAVFLFLLGLLLRREKRAARQDVVLTGEGETSPPEGGISAFFPAYNDSATLKELVEKALQVLAELTDEYEVIIVDDGSKDRTGVIADELSERFNRVKVVHHERNRGYGAAVRSGIAASSKKWIFYTDGDGQYDVEDLRRLHSLAGGADVVNGYKVKRGDPWYRRWMGGMYNRAVRLIFALPLRDVDCDFRLMRGDLARSLELRSEGGAICVELVKELQRSGAVFAEVAVNHYPRQRGKSQFFRIRNLVIMLAELARIGWRLIGEKQPRAHG